MANQQPPKTTIENFATMPHIHDLIFWFLENDKRVSLVNSPPMSQLFEVGYRPPIIIENEFLGLSDAHRQLFKKFETLGQWLTTLTFFELAGVQNMSFKLKHPIQEALKSRLEHLGQYCNKTLTKSGTILSTYGLKDPSNSSLDIELSKIPTEQEREVFKKNYFEDTFFSAQLRLLAWIYRELFNKDFKFEATPKSQPGVSESGATEFHASQITKSSAEKMKLLKGALSILISIGLLILIRNFFT